MQRFYLKGRFRFIVIQVYIHAHDLDKDAKLATYKYIEDLMIQAKKDQFQVVIMGDFNADSNKLHSLEHFNARRIHWKYNLLQLFSYLCVYLVFFKIEIVIFGI